MKLPRDISGEALARALGKLGYAVTRQTGSHIRLTRSESEGVHHLTVPRHRELKMGTLSRIVKDVGQHLSLSPEEMFRKLWG